jgi:hypothetical protein
VSIADLSGINGMRCSSAENDPYRVDIVPVIAALPLPEVNSAQLGTFSIGMEILSMRHPNSKDNTV